MSAKSKVKLVRIVLASTVGSLLWAGCAQPRVAVTDPQIIAQAPVDLTKRRPDTHPEMRTGLWQVTPDNVVADVVVAPNITPPNTPPGAVDSSYLLSYNPEVINSVPPEAQGEIIVEAAGAERPMRRSWRDWFRRKTQTPEPAPAPAPGEIRHFERETIIEREIKTEPKPYKPSSDSSTDDDMRVELMDTHFVKH